MLQALTAIEKLVAFALAKGLIEREDLPWARNLLLDALRLDEGLPGAKAYDAAQCALPATATPMLEQLIDCAIERGILPGEPAVHRELFSARLMGLLTPAPSQIARRFFDIEAQRGIGEATGWFYRLCKDNNYIRVDDIARNQVFAADSPVGRLVMTINLSRPEKDPKQIALERNLPPSGYPTCQLCVENTGYAGRLNHPARQNHRMIPLALAGDRWHMQYSPYLYYDEHCILLRDEHRPMKMGRDTFVAMFDFVDRFPHYFIGSNADLPVVGGSILSHDHFQGGRQDFPMTGAPLLRAVRFGETVRGGILDWPISSIRLISADREALIGRASAILDAWRGWSDERLGIRAHTEAPHNAITPTLRMREGEYVLDLALRNNRASEAHPLGIYHPHADLHHIKKENIGLIEAMGMFILPGRLLDELGLLEEALCAQALPALGGDMEKHAQWAQDIRARRGVLDREGAREILVQELAVKCARVLADCGVYARDEQGTEGFLRFLRSVGAAD